MVGEERDGVKDRGEVVGEEKVGEAGPPAGWQILRLLTSAFFSHLFYGLGGLGPRVGIAVLFFS